MAQFWAPEPKANVINPGPTGSPRSPAYRAAGHMSQELAGYWPRNTSADSGVLPEQRLSLDRARDLVRNDPHASAAISRLLDMLVGAGWQLVATPDARALGITADAAREAGRAIRSEWRLYTRDPRKFCDRRRQSAFSGLARTAGRTFVNAQEACAVIGYDRARRARGARYATCIELVDPDRLCNPYNAPPTPRQRGGIDFDADGAAVAYNIRKAHLADWWNSPEAMTWVKIPRETAWGRPIFVHAFEPEREGQSRAITVFAPLIGLLRMLGKHGDTELANAVANSLFTASVVTDLPTDEVADRLAAPRTAGMGELRASYIDHLANYFAENPMSLGGVRIPVLPPGSEIRMNNAPRQTANFATFQTAFLRSIAAHLGISYEQLAQDWSQTNYSSARAALNEVWRMIKRMQAVFAEQFMQPVYVAWLEECFDRGFVPGFTREDFLRFPEAWAACRWIGPGRGYIDPTKEAQASALRMESLTSTLENELADQGLELDETLDQIALENEELERRGLSRMSIAEAAATSKLAPDTPEVEEASGKSQNDSRKAAAA